MASRSIAVSRFIYGSGALLTSLLLFTRSFSNSSDLDRPGPMAWMVLGLTILGPLTLLTGYWGLVASRTEKLERGIKIGFIAHSVTALATGVAFGVAAINSPEKPLFNSGDMFIPACAVLFAVLILEFILVYKEKLIPATIVSLLFWPYWIWSVFDQFRSTEWYFNPIECVYQVLFALVPVSFAIAAVLSKSRPRLAGMLSCLSVVGIPWVYRTHFELPAPENPWINLNYCEAVQWSFHSYFSLLFGLLPVVAIVFAVLALALAVVRLLPPAWKLGTLPVCERTWPAVFFALLFTATWFSRSVVPYRVPGSVDRIHYPSLTILHIEKRGLQYHERLVTVSDRHRGTGILDVYSTSNDRRLLQYGFEQREGYGSVPKVLEPNVHALGEFDNKTGRSWDTVTQIRSWNEDAWYIENERVRRVYRSSEGKRPPEEIIALFNDLQKVSLSLPKTYKMADVCLGYCFDPISSLGYIYAGDRCVLRDNQFVCK